MQSPFAITGRPITLTPERESQVYALFAVAMGLTVAGVFVGMRFAPGLLSSGWMLLLVIAEFAILLSSPWWRKQTPLNYVLFGLFPVLSGLTITPYLMMVLAGYANGGAILLNALATTTCLSLAAAVLARGIGWDLSGLGRGLFFALLGLIIFGLLQLFVPALQTTQFELLISGAGVVIFALFAAYDIQRVSAQAAQGGDVFMLALSLYLDIFNLFLYVLRFMVALSGDRR
jgi:FtsH-binding integral membrane protein